MLQPLRGPFFLYDLPRNAKELLSVEKRLGYAPVALHLQQKGFEEQSNYHLSPGYAAEMEMIRMLKEQNRLLTLDGEKPVANLVESVVADRRSERPTSHRKHPICSIFPLLFLFALQEIKCIFFKV